MGPSFYLYVYNGIVNMSILACVVLRVYERGHQKKSPAFAAAKGGEKHE